MGASESVYVTTIECSRGAWANAKGNYSREHALHFAGRAKLKASESPFLLPEGKRKAEPYRWAEFTVVCPRQAVKRSGPLLRAPTLNDSHASASSLRVDNIQPFISIQLLWRLPVFPRSSKQ